LERVLHWQECGARFVCGCGVITDRAFEVKQPDGESFFLAIMN